jgi:hypothetical protein
VISILSARIDRHVQKMEAKLERIQATQLTLCEQLKDVRLSLPVQRRPLSGGVQRIHVAVLNAKRGGLCPCCEVAGKVNGFSDRRLRWSSAANGRAAPFGKEMAMRRKRLDRVRAPGGTGARVGSTSSEPAPRRN